MLCSIVAHSYMRSLFLSPSPFAQYLIHPFDGADMEDDDPVLRHLLNETLDVIDTPLFGQAMCMFVDRAVKRGGKQCVGNKKVRICLSK